MRMPHHTLTTRMELRSFVKPLVRNKAINIKLSLRLNFYLRCSLGGYMVGTTTGFPLEIMKALAPQSHR
jgi:hypothetical protein